MSRCAVRVHALLVGSRSASKHYHGGVLSGTQDRHHLASDAQDNRSHLSTMSRVVPFAQRHPPLLTTPLLVRQYTGQTEHVGHHIEEPTSTLRVFEKGHLVEPSRFSMNDHTPTGNGSLSSREHELEDLSNPGACGEYYDLEDLKRLAGRHCQISNTNYINRVVTTTPTHLRDLQPSETKRHLRHTNTQLHTSAAGLPPYHSSWKLHACEDPNHQHCYRSCDHALTEASRSCPAFMWSSPFEHGVGIMSKPTSSARARSSSYPLVQPVVTASIAVSRGKPLKHRDIW